MSVINKMLRDLDQRQAGMARSGTGDGMGTALGSVPLAALPDGARSAPTQPRLFWGGALLLTLVTMAGVWHAQSRQPRPGLAPLVAAPAPVTAPAVTVAVATPPVPVPVAAPSVPAPVAASSAVPATATEALPIKPAASSQPVAATLAIANAPQVTPAAPAPQAAKAAPAVDAVSKPVGKAGNAQLSDTGSAPAPNATKPLPIAAPVTSGHGASEALALAHSMWQAGSRPAAIALLQQALSRVEATSGAATPVSGQSDLARLASELARMALAEGQVSQALALLTRLEPQLSQIAEAWAMRGNAAQRLGQHAQAVKCYQQALRLKPDEPRWMMGQAVSLAALGQISEAAELTEIVRVMGALRPEVANYLRQLGVSVRAD